MIRSLFLILLLTSCAAPGNDYKIYLAKKGVTALSPENFEHCRGYGCRIVDQTSLSTADWVDLGNLMTPVKDAAEERQKIAEVIGVMEQKIGAYTGTKADIAGTYVKLGDYQHDCVDESINTTIYLSLLKDKELLHFHSIGTPSARVPPFSRALGPHQTAVISEIKTGERYAVDSWFHDNGHEAEIVSMKEWFFGWRPD